MNEMKLIKETDEIIESIRKEFQSIREAEGFENIFNESNVLLITHHLSFLIILSNPDPDDEKKLFR